MTHMKMTVGRKIYAIIVLCFVGFLGVTAFEISEFGVGLEDQKRLELKNLSDLALDVVKEEHAAAQKGTVSDADARQRAATRIKAMRYGNGEYFWINDMHPRMVMHPTTPALEGKDISDVKDPTGRRFFIDFVEVVKRAGGGVVAYEYVKPGHDKPQPKLSYVVGFAPWGWVIGTGVYIDDLKAQTWTAARTALIITAFVLLFVGAISVVVARRMATAMTGMTVAMRELASGRFDLVLPGLGRRDEIGDIAAAVEAFKIKAVEKAQIEAAEREARVQAAAEEKRRTEEREAAQRTAAAQQVDAERKATMLALADQFESAVGEIINTVSSASTELEAAARTLTDAADTTQRLSGSVAAASEEASSNVQSVACATEELTASVDEISRQVHESSQISNEAVRQAKITDARISDLSQAAGRIGDVVKLISAVAEQTNLLALNATIEAARAGEAGRGFAVVAHEVKALAAQTAKATEEISTQISGMQAATRESVGAIKEISTTIGRISDISAAVATAVEEQGAATQEIAHNVQQAAMGTADVAANITDVNRGAAETGAASTQVLASAQSLAKESTMLKSEVAKFLATVRAA